MSRRAQEIHAIIRAIGPLYRMLRLHGLTTAQRKAYSAGLCDQSSDLVHEMAETMAESPDLFAHIPVTPDELLSDQEDADALADLHAHMVLLGRLSMDAYLATQGPALDKALAVLKRVQQDDDILFNDDQNGPFRAVAVQPAKSMYEPKHQAKKGKPRRPTTH